MTRHRPGRKYSSEREVVTARGWKNQTFPVPLKFQDRGLGIGRAVSFTGKTPRLRDGERFWRVYHIPSGLAIPHLHPDTIYDGIRIVKRMNSWRFRWDRPQKKISDDRRFERIAQKVRDLGASKPKPRKGAVK